ncbi:MAG: type II toxin-antitoxin system VapC family toxin [Methylocystis sp.]
MKVVLDSSAVLAWLHGDERTPEIEALFDRIIEHGAIAPSPWRLEVANSLTMAARRKRITHAFRDEALADLDQFDIAIDTETDLHAWKASTQLSDLYGLTVYDAAYLELAQRRRMPLATLDAALARAAKAAGVDVLP